MVVTFNAKIEVAESSLVLKWDQTV